MNKTAQEMYDQACIPVTISDAELSRMMHSVVFELGIKNLEIASGLPIENQHTAIRHIRLHQQQDYCTQVQAVEDSVRQFIKSMIDLRKDWRELKYHKKYAEVVIGMVL